ncbi:MAG: hypothetical protein IPL99_12140 [Candidatus Competibacteraceae bacterium]|nr:hypothetical protein [Candidatus Competibacteraceae bacterium]
MKSTDEKAFAITLAGTLQVVYEKTVTPALLDVWFASVQQYALADVQAAFMSYVTHPTDCKFPPKPGDILRHLTAAQGDDGRPGPDEAWGLLLRLLNDERETGVLSDEIREGWTACQPILDLGDEVGARRCFLEVYARHVQEARSEGLQARWTVTLGTDSSLRETRLREAVQTRRIGSDYARSLLPGSTPTSLSKVAALLGGPDASPEQLKVSNGLKELARIIRSSSAEADQRRVGESQQRREREAERKQHIHELVEAELLQRGIHTAPPHDAQEAA